MVIGFLRGIRFWDGSPLIRGPVPCLAGWGLSLLGLLGLAVAPAAHGQTLSAGDVTETTATLTISGHTSAWYHKRTSPSAGTCSAAVAAGISVANLRQHETGFEIFAIEDLQAT